LGTYYYKGRTSSGRAIKAVIAWRVMEKQEEKESGDIGGTRESHKLGYLEKATWGASVWGGFQPRNIVPLARSGRASRNGKDARACSRGG